MKIKKLTPFFIIFILVVFLAQRRENTLLPAPEIDIISAELRRSEQSDFRLTNLSGKAVGTEDFRGRVLLLNFFETWCPPCRDEMPTLEALYQRYKDRGLTVIAVAGDTHGRKIVEPFVKEFGMSFPVLLDSNHRVNKQYRIRGIPAVFLLDRQGRIVGNFVGGADWSSDTAYGLIDRLLQEAPRSGLQVPLEGFLHNQRRASSVSLATHVIHEGFHQKNPPPARF
ncbi:MAG: TlpA family protein disulfide reductase [bacterium]|nr:TlpA family protein disulfide reductase [bacterium]